MEQQKERGKRLSHHTDRSICCEGARITNSMGKGSQPTLLSPHILHDTLHPSPQANVLNHIILHIIVTAACWIEREKFAKIGMKDWFLSKGPGSNVPVDTAVTASQLSAFHNGLKIRCAFLQQNSPSEWSHAAEYTPSAETNPRG